MNFVHQGVGEQRTKKFKLANFAALYPEERIHFNHQSILKNLEKAASEKVMFTKTKTLREQGVASRIVSRLGKPDQEELQRLIDTGILKQSHHDIQGKNFLDNKKEGVYNSTVLSTRLLDNFSEIILMKEEPFRVDKAYELLDDTMWAVIDETSEDKGEYILYNTVNFLLDEGAASIELIAQSVMLDESEISKRVTTAFAQAPDYNLERPNHLKASELINEALETNTFANWSNVA